MHRRSKPIWQGLLLPVLQGRPPARRARVTLRRAFCSFKICWRSTPAARLPTGAWGRPRPWGAPHGWALLSGPALTALESGGPGLASLLLTARLAPPAGSREDKLGAGHGPLCPDPDVHDLS